MQIIWQISQSETSPLNTVFALLPSCSEGSPHLPPLSNHMCWTEHVVRLGRLQQERRQRREGMRGQRSRVGGGVSATAARALKRDKSSGGTPASSQMNISACLLPPVSISGFFHPLHYSLADSQSRAHSSSCRSSRSAEPLPPAFTFPPSSEHGESKLALFCCWDGNWAPINLLS